MMVAKGLLFLLCAAVVVLANDKKETYTDKYDNINVQEILDNERLKTAYVNCLLDKGNCTPEGKELKEHLQEAIEMGCEKCTEAQKKKATEIIEHLIKHEIEIWNKLCAKYDPEGKWRKKYEEEAKAKGIVIPQ